MLKIDVFAVLFMNELKNLTNTKMYVFCAKKNATQSLELKSHRKGERPLTDIRGRIYNSIAGGSIVQ
jgi:hypothetical protein